MKTTSTLPPRNIYFSWRSFWCLFMGRKTLKGKITGKEKYFQVRLQPPGVRKTRLGGENDSGSSWKFLVCLGDALGPRIRGPNDMKSHLFLSAIFPRVYYWPPLCARSRPSWLSPSILGRKSSMCPASYEAMCSFIFLLKWDTMTTAWVAAAVGGGGLKTSMENVPLGQHRPAREPPRTPNGHPVISSCHHYCIDGIGRRQRHNGAETTFSGK